MQDVFICFDAQLTSKMLMTKKGSQQQIKVPIIIFAMNRDLLFLRSINILSPSRIECLRKLLLLMECLLRLLLLGEILLATIILLLRRRWLCSLRRRLSISLAAVFKEKSYNKMFILVGKCPDHYIKHFWVLAFKDSGVTNYNFNHFVHTHIFVNQ